MSPLPFPSTFLLTGAGRGPGRATAHLAHELDRRTGPQVVIHCGKPANGSPATRPSRELAEVSAAA